MVSDSEWGAAFSGRGSHSFRHQIRVANLAIIVHLSVAGALGYFPPQIRQPSVGTEPISQSQLTQAAGANGVLRGTIIPRFIVKSTVSL